MPELPEVEFARSCLERWLGGEKLARVEAEPTRVLRGSSVDALTALSGRRVEKIERRGKWLLLTFDRELGLIGHLGMTGKFELQRPGEPAVRWSRARFVRKDRAIVHFRDPRMFGRLLPGHLNEIVREEGFATLGPDAWREPLSGPELAQRLAGSRRPIKDALLDQTILAGIGNIQATEALFRAGVHPARPAAALTKTEFQRIAAGIHWSLARTLAMNKGDKITYVEESGSEENPFLVYGRAGEACPECGRTLDKQVIGGRTSVYCPVCQRLPRPTAGRLVTAPPR